LRRITSASYVKISDEIGPVYRVPVGLANFVLYFCQTSTNCEKILENGLKLHKEKKYAEEIRFFDKIIKIKPNYTYGIFRTAIAFLELKKYYEAIFWFDKTFEMNKKIKSSAGSSLFYGKGMALYHIDHYNEALCCYNKALDGLTKGHSMRSLDSRITISCINFILTEKVRVLQKLVKRGMK